MPLPAGWPPRVASGRRSIRVYIPGTTTIAFADNAYLFAAVTGANTFLATPYVPPGGESVTVNLGDNQTTGSPMGGGRDPHDADYAPAVTPGLNAPPVPMIWSYGIRIYNDGAAHDLQFSFDGSAVHGIVKPLTMNEYWIRHEAGIALRWVVGATDFRVEAW